MAGKSRDLGWPGFFRLFTVLCAILLLLAQAGQELVTAGSGQWQVLSVYEGLTRWAVPALFMLWGMFALETGKPQLSGTLTGLVLPAFCQLVFWGAVYAVVSHLLGRGAVSLEGIWGALLSAAKGNTYFHLWVLYPLIGLYLVHPVLHRFVSSASRGEVRYFLGLCFLLANLLPLWSAFHPDSLWIRQLERLDIHLALGWVGCYVGGWYLRHYVIGRIPEFVLYALGILGLVLTLMGPGLLGGDRALWYGYAAPNVVLTAAAFCALFRYVLGVSEERARKRAVYEVGAYAFGIYLVHQLWVMVFQWFGISMLSLPVVLSAPLFALAYFLLSLPLAWLINLIPVVGERLT